MEKLILVLFVIGMIGVYVGSVVTDLLAKIAYALGIGAQRFAQAVARRAQK